GFESLLLRHFHLESLSSSQHPIVSFRLALRSVSRSAPRATAALSPPAQSPVLRSSAPQIVRPPQPTQKNSPPQTRPLPFHHSEKYSRLDILQSSSILATLCFSAALRTYPHLLLSSILASAAQSSVSPPPSRVKPKIVFH